MHLFSTLLNSSPRLQVGITDLRRTYEIFLTHPHLPLPPPALPPPSTFLLSPPTQANNKPLQPNALTTSTTCNETLSLSQSPDQSLPISPIAPISRIAPIRGFRGKGKGLLEGLFAGMRGGRWKVEGGRWKVAGVSWSVVHIAHLR